jgi:hypothetical protein
MTSVNGGTSEAVDAQAPGQPPRDFAFRSLAPGPEVRQLEDGTSILAGHLAVFNEWTEINSRIEGHFMERLAPGAFKKTFSETLPKVLYNHGNDPSVGQKPLGSIRNLGEDEKGAFYEVDLLDTSYNRDLVEALKAGLLGSSFRFRSIREDYDRDATASEHNPKGLPERTLREVGVPEFGPVTFPQYPSATAGVRSVTDDYVAQRLVTHPDGLLLLRALLIETLPGGTEEDAEEPDAPVEDRAEPEAHPVHTRRASDHLFGMPQEANPSWQL